MTAELLARTFINGLCIGSLYVLVVVGLDIIIKTTTIANFAHGQFYVIGAFVFLLSSVVLNLNLILALILTLLVLALVGCISYLFVFDTLQRTFKPGVPVSTRLYKSAMISIGLMMILGQATLLGFGSRARGMPAIFPQVINIANITFPVEKLVLVPASLLILGGLYLFFFRTKLGKVLRAVSSDAEASSLLGMPNRWVYMLGFVLGCTFAGIAGAMVAPIYSINHSMGDDILFLALIVMTVGGIGSYRGAILGGLFVGMGLSFGYLFIGGLVMALLFVLSLILLIFRPGGLLGVSLE